MAGKLLDTKDLHIALEETLANGRCDISIYLESNTHAELVREQIRQFVITMSAEPIEILTFFWGFRLMKLRLTQPLSELERQARESKWPEGAEL